MVTKSKIQRYRELIKAVKDDYEQNERKVTKKGVTVQWTEACKSHINLWSYWQGSLDAKILLVGQDWGEFSALKINLKDIAKFRAEKRMLENFRKIDNGDENARYYDGVDVAKDKIFITDRNLVELFRALGSERGDAYETFQDIVKERYTDLFFTNLCLGYRTDGSSGECLQSWLTGDVKYFKGLLDIIEPQVVLCLGKLTYETIAVNMCEEKGGKKFSYELLEDNGNYFDINKNGIKCRVFGLAHPGGMGMANRKTQSTKCNDSAMTGMELQKKDWENIGKYLAYINK